MPQISVIIPIYQVEKTLRRCVDSVLAQTFTDYEVILVDDGSPDGCGAICDEYERQHACVSVIHKENGGLSSARNAGLETARGVYVMFLDSDDYLAEDCLETLAGHDADMVIGTITFVNAGEQEPRQDGWFYPAAYPQLLPALLRESRLNYLHAKLYRRSVIDANGLCFEDDMLTSAEDTVFNFTFLKHCNSIFVSGKPVHFYVKQPTGLGSRFYFNRHARYVRLNDFIENTCREMGVFSDLMECEINRRRVLAALWSINIMFRQQNISHEEERAYLEQICADARLREVVGSVSVAGKEEVEQLLDLGADAYLKQRLAQQRHMRLKGSIARRTPAPLKKFLKKCIDVFAAKTRR